MKGKTNEQKYQKKTPREHVLLRPDTYVGDVDPTDEDMWICHEDKITKNTRLIWIETPTNPMMNIIDIKSLAKLSKKNKILLCVDNTFASPYLQRPLELGADIIIHSATKYIAGHSDVIIGAIVINNKSSTATEW